MITIGIRPGADPQRAIQKLKNKLIQEGLFAELKKRKHYCKPSMRKRLKREEAERQRVKDFRKSIAKAQQDEDSFLR